MSLAGFKKKYYASHNLSHNTPYGFSLNSSRRLEGHHQEPALQTLFRGNAIPHGTIVNSQRVNYDPYNKQRPSIKSNQSLISKMLWSKPIVKIVGANNYGNYYATINSHNHCTSDSTKSTDKYTCNTGYSKDLTVPSYETYQNTTLLYNKCIPPPPSLQHLPIAGNGLPCGLNI